MPRNAKQTQSGANGDPSTITWRRPSPRSVSGSSRATALSASGIASIGKNVPDRNISGNWTALVIPFAES
jgi:hypothetical protein